MKKQQITPEQIREGMGRAVEQVRRFGDALNVVADRWRAQWAAEDRQRIRTARLRRIGR